MKFITMVAVLTVIAFAISVITFILTKDIFYFRVAILQAITSLGLTLERRD